MFGHVFWELFNWPAGIVVGNLIASFLWAAPALIHLHHKVKRADNTDQLRDVVRQIELLDAKLIALTEVKNDSPATVRLDLGVRLDGADAPVDV